MINVLFVKQQAHKIQNMYKSMTKKEIWISAVTISVSIIN